MNFSFSVFASKAAIVSGDVAVTKLNCYVRCTELVTLWLKISNTLLQGNKPALNDSERPAAVIFSDLHET
jgi:hypothetical protein